MLKKFSIKVKLLILTGISLAGMLLMLLFLNIGINTTHELANAEAKIEAINADMLMLRRNEKDFILRKDLKYKQKFEKNVKKLHKNVSILISVLESNGIDSTKIKEFDRHVDSYKNTFIDYIKKQQAIGLSHNEGLYGSLRASVHKIQSSAKELNEYQLLAWVYDLRKQEKDFMLRRDVKYVEKFSKKIDKLLEFIRQDNIDLSSSQKDTLLTILKSYKSDFLDLVQAEKELGLTSKLGLQGDLRKIIHKAEKLLAQETEHIIHDADARISELKIVEEVISVFIILVIIVLSYLTTRGISRNIDIFQEGLLGFFDYLNKIKSEVDLLDTTNNDEIGSMAKVVNENILTIKKGLEADEKTIQEVIDIAQRIEKGIYNYGLTTTPHNPALLELKGSINKLIGSTQEKLEAMIEVLIEYADSNYSFEVDKKYDNVTGSVGTVLMGIQSVGQGASELLAIVTNTGNQLKTSNEAVTHMSAELSTAANEQAASLEETAAALEEITATVTSNHESIQKMASLSSEVTQSVSLGEKLANQTVNSMEAINEEVNAISEEIIIIDQIAFQTNILSLNAAVEAATAGESGKGFAVVAQEVRNLASRSAEAAKEIKELVDNANEKANRGKIAANKMIDGYNELNTTISQTTAIIKDVSTASKEQQEGIEQINDAVTQLDQATQENASTSQEMSTLASQSLELADTLLYVASKTNFKEEIMKQVCNMDVTLTVNTLKLDHLKFKENNFKKSTSFEKFTVVNENQCRLGKWIEENKGKAFAKTSEWKELLVCHHNVHNGVQTYVDLISDNASNDELLKQTVFIEENINKVFKDLDSIKILNCQ